MEPSVLRLVQNDHASIAAWVASRIPIMDGASFGGGVTAIGVVGTNETPLCGVVFHDYHPRYQTMAFSIAASSPKWATRNIVKGLLSYPFVQLQVRKLWTTTPHKNLPALRMLEFVGFKREAQLAWQFNDEHAIISRMFLKDYKKKYGDA